MRNITIVDSGKVSYSNPVRQSLYTHAHCINSNTYKAIAAADMLRAIHPEIVSSMSHCDLSIYNIFYMMYVYLKQIHFKEKKSTREYGYFCNLYIFGHKLL